MTKDDLLITFLMRNDPEVCKYAQTPDPISWYEHEAVFNYTDWPKYVYTCPQVIGYVDFRHDTINDNPNVKIWSFHLDAPYRGKGLSELMLTDAIEEAKRLGIKTIWGVVKKNNAASNYLHKKLNFAIIKEENENYIYELILS